MTSSSPSTAPSGLTSELVTAIDHVGIAVPDLDAAIAWYG
nr:methylmalonyl-CoA epimerase [Prescottella equi]